MMCTLVTAVRGVLPGMEVHEPKIWLDYESCSLSFVEALYRRRH